MVTSEQQRKIQIALAFYRAEFSTEALVQLVQLYLHTTAIQLERLKDAVAHNELKAARDIGHALKSTSASLGIESLQQTCLQIETIVDTMELNNLYMRASWEFQIAKQHLLYEIKKDL